MGRRGCPLASFLDSSELAPAMRDERQPNADLAHTPASNAGQQPHYLALSLGPSSLSGDRLWLASGWRFVKLRHPVPRHESRPVALLARSFE